MPQASDFIPPNLIDPRSVSLPSPPPPNPAFDNRLDGVVIPVWEGDTYLAKACCASIRQCMGDIPITLLVDGLAADTRDLQRLHGVQRMNVQEAADAEVVRLCSGTPWTKMILFWASPYERFLCLDADLLVWGDLREYAEFDKFDFIVTYPYHRTFTFNKPEDILRCVTSMEVFRKLDPALNWIGQEEDNTGVFYGRRGIFSRENLMALRKLECWPCYESGVFHFLFWRALRDGVPRAIGRKLQLFPADQTSVPEDRFFPRDGGRPAVIHWITKKPKLGRRYRASDDYRKLFLKMTGKTTWLNTRLLLEDLKVWAARQRRSLRKRTRHR